MDIRTAIFVGKPGSGKGTQAKLLAEKTGWHVLASGDAFRAIAAEDSAVGRKVKAETEQGFLMPPWFASYLFQKSIFAIPADEGVVFDGFGRKVPEAELVRDVLHWLERPFRVVHIAVSDELVIDRLTKRREVSGRADDHNIEKRLDEYRIHTEPSIEVFHRAGELVEVDGSLPPEEVHAAIMRAIIAA